MNIPRVAMQMIDGSFTDADTGRLLTSDEAFLAGSYVDHCGRGFIERCKLVGSRFWRRREWRTLAILLDWPSPTFDGDCHDLVAGRAG